MSLISFLWGWVFIQALSVADEKLKELERQIASVTVASQQEREYIAEITSLKVRMLGVLVFCSQVSWYEIYYTRKVTLSGLLIFTNDLCNFYI